VRNVLIFSGSHSISSLHASDPGSRISAHLAHSLARTGWRSVVITQYKGNETDQPPVNLEDIPACLSAAGETGEVVLRVKAEQTPGRGLVRASQRLHGLQSGGKWVKPVWGGIASGMTGLAYLLGDSHESGGGWSSIAARAGMQVARSLQVDALVGITGWDAMIAAQRCHRQTSLPWIQIFHDPWQVFIAPAGRPLLALYLDRLVLRSAAAICQCTPTWSRELEQELHRPISCLINSYAAEHMAASKPRQFDRFTVVYSGTLDPGVRDPELFLAGMVLLRQEMPALAEKMQFIYIGSQADFLWKRAREFGVSDLVQCVGSLSALDVLPYIKGAHLLLMLLDQTNPFRVGCLTSKSAEYIGSGRPVLLIARTRNDEDTDLIRLVRDTGSGWAVREAAGVAGVLRQAYKQYDELGNTLSPGGGCTATGDLTYEHQTKKLAWLLERVSSGGIDPRFEDLEVAYPWSRTT
jgi:glycosyltransferase involved in cell wall biosynthesis